jgi:hypothetical protein
MTEGTYRRASAYRLGLNLMSFSGYLMPQGVVWASGM